MKPKIPLLALTGILLLVAMVLAGTAVPDVQADAAVFINEIHYDNTSTDANESIEVAGPAATDLAGWSLVLYNGSNGTSYNTLVLSGAIPDLQNGFGAVFVSYPVNGIQNGAPDGIALVDPSNVVQQFLCYEGTFTAVGGPADGQTCVDIGVAQSSSTPVGSSLQLEGTGMTYDDFTWANEQPNTFGAVNTGQSFADGDAAPSVASTTPADGASNVALDANVEVTFSEAVDTAPGAFGITCTSNGSQAFVLSGGPTSFTLNPDADLPEGDACSVIVTAAAVTDQDSDDPPDNMAADYAFGFTTVSSAPLPDIVINETDSDTPGTDVAEFVELYDGGVGSTALNGLVVVFYNGNGDASYNSFDLDGFSTNSDGYFLLGNSGVTPLPDITFGSNGLQNGADAVAVYLGNASDFPNGTTVTTNNLIDAIVYDTSDGDDAGLLALLNAAQPQVNEAGAGDKDNHSNQRCPDGSGGARNTDSYEQWDPTPGAANICEVVVLPLTCTDDSVITLIHEVQGSGLTSPIEGNIVVIDGVVVGDFQDDGLGANGDLNGFHVQEETADSDSDPSTSEGVFVYAPGLALDVANGDRVRVRGEVDEYETSSGASSMTQVRLSAIALCADPGDQPPATPVTLPVAAISDLEPFEGMSVIFPQNLEIVEYYNFDRFNETVLATTRQFQPTAVFEPGSTDAADLADLNARSRITLDDGRTSQNSDPAIHPNGFTFDLTNLFRGGSTVSGVIGVIDENFGLYRIHPTSGGTHTDSNPRQQAPDPVGGKISVASLNVLNYFTTLDQGGNLCGPPGFEDDCRGANDANELTRQRTKIVAALAGINADVVGLIEVQNDEGASIADLVAGLNDDLGAGTYAYIDSGYVGTDVIKVGFIYKPASVTPTGDSAVLDTPDFIDPNNTGSPKNRAALAQTFMDNDGGAFTAVVNHLKSKGSPCGAGDDDPEQGSCNLTRTLAAQKLINWLATDPTGSGDPDFAILGDLNAYDKEDPIDALVSNGYTDLIAQFTGEFAYSYVFSAQLGYLDYAMTNASLSSQVTGVTEWHINADEPDILDYDTSYKQPAQQALFEPNAFRASDHDPVIFGLDLIGPPMPIGEIQGAGHVSPFDGQRVTTKGIVTAHSYTGYYVQDANVDANDLTADGLFVYMGNGCSGCPNIGDEVLLTDYVSEHIAGGAATGNLSTTQMSFPATTVLSTGNPLPEPVVIGTSGRIAPAVDVISRSERPVNLQTDPGVFNPDNDGIDFYEALEGMLVTIEDPVAVSGTRTYNSFSSEMFVLTNNGAHIDPTDARTARGGINLQPDLNNDGDQNPERVQIQFDGTLYPFAVPAINVGDRLGNVTGVMGYSFGNFEVNATQEVVVNPAGLETETTRLKGTKGAVTVASYNVLNLSPDASDDNQRATLASQIVNNLRSPDVIALQEIQDNSGDTDDGVTDADETLQALVDAIAAAGGPDYAFFDVAPADGASGGVPGGNIRNAYLYNPRRVKLVDFESLTPDVLSEIGVSEPDAFFGTRDPLLATFKFRGKEFKVINNHLTSRYGSTPVFGGPQPFVQAGEVERAAQTGALNEVVDALLDNGKCRSRHALLDKELLGTEGRGKPGGGHGHPPGWCDKHHASKAARVIVLGDLNTMEFTDDIKHILPGTGRNKVLTNLIDKLRDDNVYTYNFEGNSQVLDHLLVSKALRRGAKLDIVHVNVDFARVNDAFGSDHEPLLVRLRIGGR